MFSVIGWGDLYDFFEDTGEVVFFCEAYFLRDVEHRIVCCQQQPLCFFNSSFVYILHGRDAHKFFELCINEMSSKRVKQCYVGGS